MDHRDIQPLLAVLIECFGNKSHVQGFRVVLDLVLVINVKVTAHELQWAETVQLIGLGAFYLS